VNHNQKDPNIFHTYLVVLKNKGDVVTLIVGGLNLIIPERVNHVQNIVLNILMRGARINKNAHSQRN
jgi:hypothetical protein